MIVVFTGSRDWTDVATVERALRQFTPKTDLVIEGGHRVYENLGVPQRREMYRIDVSLDAIVNDQAKVAGFDVLTVWAPWIRLGKYAGHYRNGVMLDIAQAMGRTANEAVVVEAFPLPQSKGTTNMMEQAKGRGIPVATHLPTLRH